MQEVVKQSYVYTFENGGYLCKQYAHTSRKMKTHYFPNVTLYAERIMCIISGRLVPNAFTFCDVNVLKIRKF